MSRDPTQICGVCQATFGDGTCVHVSGTGTTDDPYVPELVIDPDADNIIDCGPNGLGAFLQPIYSDPPAVHCYATLDQVAGWDAATALEFDANRYDTDGMHDVEAKDTGPIFIKTPGIYLITLNVLWKKTNDSTATGDLAAFILKNGTEYLALDSFPVNNSDSDAKHSLSREHAFAAGDFVSAVVKQDVLVGTTKLNLSILTDRMSPNFTATFLRPIEGMTIVGVDTEDANTGGGSGGVGSQYTLNGSQWWDTPDHSSLDITSDIDIRVAAALTDWTPASLSPNLVSKFDGVSDAYVFQLWPVPADGRLRLDWRPTQPTFAEGISSVAPTVADGANLGLRATLDVNNGSGSFEVKFWTKSITPATALTDIESNSGWSQLGTTQTGAVTSIQASTANLSVGSTNGLGNFVTGSIYAAVIKSGINGTTVANPDFYHNNSPFQDSTGKTWTKH